MLHSWRGRQLRSVRTSRAGEAEGPRGGWRLAAARTAYVVGALELAHEHAAVGRVQAQLRVEQGAQVGRGGRGVGGLLACGFGCFRRGRGRSFGGGHGENFPPGIVTWWVRCSRGELGELGEVEVWDHG